MKKLPIIFLLFIGCNLRPSDEELLQHMVVQTRYDENTAYSFYNSFTLSPDTLGLLSNISSATYFKNQYSIDVTAELKSKMEEAGYLFLLKVQNPDLGFAASVVENYNVIQEVNYQPYYTGYYGYGYGGYYGVPYVSTYSTYTNMLVINLIDLKNRDGQNRLKVLWTAYIGDLSKSVDREQKVLEAIRQAFEQSPYLRKP